MKFSLLFIFLLTSAALANAENLDQTNACISKDRVQIITSRFKLSFPGQANYCDQNNYYYRMVKILLFVYDLEFDKELQGKEGPFPYQLNITGYDWFNRLATTMPNIYWAANEPTCIDTLAFALRAPKKVGICSLFFGMPHIKGQFRTIDSVAILLHESRHFEGYGYMHIDCPSKWSGGDKGCDVDINDNGAYTVSVEAYLKLGVSAKNLSRAERYYALRTGIYLANDKFLNPAINLKPGGTGIILTGQEAKQHWAKIPGDEVFSIFSYLPPGRLMTIFQELLFFPNDPELPAQSFFGDEIDGEAIQLKAPSQDSLLKIYNEAAPEKRKTFKDLFVFGGEGINISAMIWEDNILLLRTDVVGKNRQQTQTTVFLPSGKPLLFRQINGAKPDTTGKFYVLNNLDQVFEIDFRKNQDANVTEVKNEYPGFGQVIYRSKDNGASIYLLNKDGQLFQETSPKRFQLVEQVKGIRFDFIITSPFINHTIPDEHLNILKRITGKNP